MRPLPIEPLPQVPLCVVGSSIVRGKITPIVDLRILLGDDDHDDPKRLVTLRLDEGRLVGLLVDEVLGIERELNADVLPPLVQDASDAFVEDLARLDNQVLTVLRAAHLLPAGIDQRLSEAEVSQ